jgi:surface-anchored protein
MNKLTISSVALLVLGFAPVALAQTNISSGHWDIAAHEHLHAGETELELELHNHDLGGGAPLEGSTITYNFGTNAKSNVTIGANDLGDLWVSPASEVDADAAGMPFIGFSAEELLAPFTGPVTFTMTGFVYTGSGAGNFYMFEGTDLFFDSTAGPGSYGSFSVGAGTHGHGEFGFSDAGLYEITLVASGNNGEPVNGAPATFTFDVVPEPSTYALLGLGAGALALMRWRKRNRQN